MVQIHHAKCIDRMAFAGCNCVVLGRSVKVICLMSSRSLAYLLQLRNPILLHLCQCRILSRCNANPCCLDILCLVDAFTLVSYALCTFCYP